MTLRGKAGAYGMPCLIEIFIGDLGCESLSPGAELREVHWVHPHPRKKPNLCCCRHTSTTCAPPRLQALHPQGAQQQANSKFSCPQDPASHSAKYCTPIIVFHEHILYHIYWVQHPLISIRLYICFSSCMMRRRSFHQLMLLLLLSQRKHLVLLVPRCLGQCELRTSDW